MTMNEHSVSVRYVERTPGRWAYKQACSCGEPAGSSDVTFSTRWDAEQDAARRQSVCPVETAAAWLQAHPGATAHDAAVATSLGSGVCSLAAARFAGVSEEDRCAQIRDIASVDASASVVEIGQRHGYTVREVLRALGDGDPRAVQHRKVWG